MASVDEVEAVLNVLCRYYTDRGSVRELNDTQKAVYLDGLAEFDAADLERAARKWMRDHKWFPMLSDLRELLDANPDWAALAALAWTTFERAISQAGTYRGATFVDPGIGETVRQVFGSWEHACSYDRDSPGWTIRRQTFLSIFPVIAPKAGKPVTLRGLSPVDTPLLIAHVEAMPEPKRLLQAEDRSIGILAEVTRRFKVQRGGRE